MDKPRGLPMGQKTQDKNAIFRLEAPGFIDGKLRYGSGYLFGQSSERIGHAGKKCKMAELTIN